VRTHLYLALFVVGTIVPYLSFVPWVMDHGFDISRMIEELFANRISAFFALDVIIATVVFWVFVAFEAPRLGLRHAWAPVAASLTIGLSSALPLFLFMRERRLAP
jgi:hypothetical protein